ncbi:MAG: DUF327 family protein [Synergistaceae bacterium]|nr:DUF327 family protein [Synergistaceae bacterium]MBR0096244.1 DUF327 family protein [Synergistaceae bacterium]MBR0222180.1 DUF327 family protein [Synergistaceae bacterium]
MSAIQIKRGVGGGGELPKVDYGGGSGHNIASGNINAASSFASSFDSALEAGELEDLLDKLYDISARLSVYPAAKLISEYRAVLSELLKRALKRLKIKRDLRWRKTDRKLYVTIERVEAAMDELEEAFLYEGDRTRALSLMEEIKGCIISLLM